MHPTTLVFAVLSAAITAPFAVYFACTCRRRRRSQQHRRVCFLPGVFQSAIVSVLSFCWVSGDSCGGGGDSDASSSMPHPNAMFVHALCVWFVVALMWATQLAHRNRKRSLVVWLVLQLHLVFMPITDALPFLLSQVALTALDAVVLWHTFRHRGGTEDAHTTTGGAAAVPTPRTMMLMYPALILLVFVELTLVTTLPGHGSSPSTRFLMLTMLAAFMSIQLLLCHRDHAAADEAAAALMTESADDDAFFGNVESFPDRVPPVAVQVVVPPPRRRDRDATATATATADANEPGGGGNPFGDDCM
jgi:hypothetical protein